MERFSMAKNLENLSPKQSDRIKMREIKQRYDLPFCLMSLYRKAARGEMPKPFKLGRNLFWSRSELDAFFTAKGLPPREA